MWRSQGLGVSPLSVLAIAFAAMIAFAGVSKLATPEAQRGGSNRRARLLTAVAVGEVAIAGAALLAPALWSLGALTALGLALTGVRTAARPAAPPCNCFGRAPTPPRKWLSGMLVVGTIGAGLSLITSATWSMELGLAVLAASMCAAGLVAIWPAVRDVGPIESRRGFLMKTAAFAVGVVAAPLAPILRVAA